jgi:hypothetical protein
MPKERKGTVWYEADRGCYRIKLTLNDGARPVIDLTPTARSPQAEERAKEVAAERSKMAREKDLRAEDFGLKPRGKTRSGTRVPPGRNRPTRWRSG